MQRVQVKVICAVNGKPLEKFMNIPMEMSKDDLRYNKILSNYLCINIFIVVFFLQLEIYLYKYNADNKK